ncbi:hypothetical protein ACM9HF_06970 [Colwellia sp. RE-S-Sl-9]
MKKTLVGATLLSLTSFYVLADNTTKVFEVKRGFAKTFSVSQTEQLGKFKAVLKSRRDGGELSAEKLVLKGTIKGILNSNFTLNHTFVNKERTGVLYTANDSMTNILAGDATCENGTGSIPFEIEETLHLVAGTGIYAGIEQGSFILLKGVINNCPSLPEYGQNTFEVVGGSVIFTQ